MLVSLLILNIMGTKSKMNRNRRTGRPATGKGVQVVVRMQRDLLTPLDKYVSSINAKSRAAAIRELLRELFRQKGLM